MTYKQLGRCGLRVSPVCLGTMTFGREADEETSYAIMDYFVEQGYNFLDTADAYSTGATEEVVGRWLKARGNRHSLVIATKVYGAMGPGPNDQGLSRAHIMSAVDASLRRLQIDYIDIYQIHRWDPDSPVEETLEALDDLVRAGKIRYMACSNLKGYQLSRFLDLSRRDGRSRFVSIQPIYNALNRGIELEVLPLAEDEGLGVIPYNPLAGGMLTGKYRRAGGMPAGARLTDYAFYNQRYYNDRAFDVVEAFLEHAKTLSVTPAQLALAWSMAEPRVTAPIIGARSMEQITDTLKGTEITLTPAERDAVPAIESGRWVGVDPVYDRDMAKV